MKRALLSVSDKTGIIEFAKKLVKLDFEIVSTGGTYDKLVENNINAISISDITNFPECLDGRLKTLHPNVHGGILAIRSNKEHMDQLNNLNIKPIDLVVVNLYPFKETILKDETTLETAIENIDIGGPTMIRAAAKNYNDVTVIVNPEDYNMVINEIEENGKVSVETNFKLSAKVFNHTAQYDALIANYLQEKSNGEQYPKALTLTYEKVQDMRYGENPHQTAAFYKEITNAKGLLTNAIQLHGKELSFNNINDTHGALELLKDFTEPTIVACKHSNPCGVGSGLNIHQAYLKAYNSDPISIFGGIIVSNREINIETATEISKIFIEIVLAPDFSEEALALLSKKKNIRLLKLDYINEKQPEKSIDIKKVSGGIVVQNIDNVLLTDKLDVVTKRTPTKKEMEDLLFTWKIVRSVKSNGIALGKDSQSIGIGPGQVNRIWACQQAIEHGINNLGADFVKGSVLASDAFFPFDDCVEEAYKHGITAIIQPGGSVKDQDSIDKCDKYGIAMIFTGIRHFRH